MMEHDEYQAHVAECLRLAEETDNKSEQRTWHMLAECWLRLRDFHRAAEKELDSAKCEVSALEQNLDILRGVRHS